MNYRWKRFKDFAMHPLTVVLIIFLVCAFLGKLVHAQVPTGNIPAGVYTLDGKQFVVNTSMIGQGNVTIRGSGTLYIQNNSMPSVNVRGIIFDGVQLCPDRSSGMNANLTIDNNQFINGANITWNVGLANSSITNNTWIGEARGGYAIFGLNYNGLTVANNLLKDIRSGIHIDAKSSGNNLLIDQNVVDGYCGIAYEFQGAGNNITVTDSYALRPNEKYGDIHVGAFSVPNDKGKTTRIRRNTVRGNARIPRYAVEIGGDDVLAEDNFIEACLSAFPNNDGIGTTSAEVKNNRVDLIGQGGPAAYLAFPATGRTLTQSNNVPNLMLTWNVNRDLPAPNRRLGTLLPPPAMPTTLLSDYNILMSDRDRLRTRMNTTAAELDRLAKEEAKP